jgi:hypothetical protein
MPHDPSKPLIRQPIQLEGEIWKPIPSSEGRYEASSFGRIRSLMFGCQKGTIPRKQPLVCTPYWNGKAYWVFNMRLSTGTTCRQLGSLILEAHAGPAPTERHEAAHEDGNTSNNKIENLAWKTPKENSADKYVHGTVPFRNRRDEDTVETFQCTRCHEWKPRSGFYGLTEAHPSVCKITSECRKCATIRKREYRRRKAADKRSARSSPLLAL